MSDAPHPTDVRVGRLLRERRLELGISQERLGALLGVTYQQVQKYERGTNRIGSSRLHELCRILGVRASYFFDEPASTSQGLGAMAALGLFEPDGLGRPRRVRTEPRAAGRALRSRSATRRSGAASSTWRVRWHAASRPRDAGKT